MKVPGFFRPFGSGCNVRTQDPENFDEEVKSLVTAWRIQKTSSNNRSIMSVSTLQELVFIILSLGTPSELQSSVNP